MAFLVAYYSRAGENYFGGNIVSVEKGNTEKVAMRLAAFTEAVNFKIEQAKPYSNNYMECVEEAKADMESNARPELTILPRDLDDYDDIFICYPIYCGTVPMAVLTFLESFDFEGKIIHPVCTHEGSGFGNSVADIAKACPGAEIGEGFAVMGSDADKCENALEGWLKNKVGYIVW